MNTALRNAICLHCKADELTFLNSPRRRIARLLGNRLRSIELTTPASRVAALLETRRTPSGLVIIFAHGGSDYLHGGDYRRQGELLRDERFVNSSNFDVFEGKVVFCMSCNSNELAPRCIEAGAVAFVGFDDIPLNLYDEAGGPIGSIAVINHLQRLVAAAAGATLERFLTAGVTLEEAVDFLRLWVSKEAVAYIKKFTRERDRRQVAALFLALRHGVHYHGQRNIFFA